MRRIARRMIVTAPGSLGDVNPLLAIARELRQAGHDVLFFAAERYLHLAARAGLQTKSLVSEVQFQRLAGDPRLWHPRHGARLIFREAVEHFLASHYQWLEEHCDPDKTVLISHVLDFAGRIYRDRYPRTIFISVLPAPASLRSRRSPPRLSSFFWERWIPRVLLPLLYRGADIWVDRIGGHQINQLRRSLGLNSVHRIIHHWWWSPDLVLCLFPEWFSIASQDLLPQMKLVGFPLADSADIVDERTKGQLKDILESLGDARPIVFAPGTAHHHARGFLNSAVEVCRQLNSPGVIISSDATQFPSELPHRVFSSSYLPFSKLLPHAAAIMHHGGVGTTSQALSAGVPQVVLPMAFDQFDNAERISRLGCGSWLPMRKQSPPRLIEHLNALPHTAVHARKISKMVRGQAEAAAKSVQLIQALLEERESGSADVDS